MPDTRTPMQMRLLTLQVLRFLAAWTVVFHHYMQGFHELRSSNHVGQFFSHFGSFGVDVFFLISGFIMVYSISKSSKSNLEFLTDRLFRVTPAYWAATILFLMLVVVFRLQPSGEWDVDTAAFFKSLFFIPHENPGSGRMHPILSVGWSLNFEMFFYVLIFMCMVIAKEFWIFICATFLILLPIFWPANSIYSAILCSRLLWEFVAGIVLCVVHLNTNSLPGIRYSWIAPICFIWAVYFLVVGGPLLGGEFSFERLLAASLSLWGALCREQWVPRNQIGFFLARLGEISYSTYLIHISTLIVLVQLLPAPDSPEAELITIVVYAVLTWMLSELFYRHVEKSHAIAAWKSRLLE